MKNALGSQVEIGLWLPKITIPLFEQCPYVDWIAPATSQSQQLIQTLQQYQVTTVILTRHSAREALLARWAGVKTVIGFRSQRVNKAWYLHWGLGLTHAVAHPVLTNQRHQQDYLWDLLVPLSLPQLDKTDRALALWVSSEQRMTFQQYLTQTFGATDAEKNSWIVVHWASASANKEVSLDCLTQGLQALLQQNPTAQLFFTGMASHAPLYEAFLAKNPFLQAGTTAQAPRCVNLAGKTSLQELAVLLSLSHGLIGLDSAPLHMASALKVPHIVGVYGAVSPKQWAPPIVEGVRFEAVSLVLPCKPCIAKTCETNACRTDLLPSQLSVAISRAFNLN
jgi:ADP-heptose:LPS heptosyltransferase